ncbi:flavin reductase family protein [Streptomyces sp. NPDC004838]
MNSINVHESFDAQELRRVFASFPSGVAAVAAVIDGRPVGMAASSFVSVSLEPPLVSVSFSLTSRTWTTLRRARRIGISVLAAEQEATCRQMAGPEDRRFQGVHHSASPHGAVRLDGASAWFDCSVHTEFKAGDHTVVIFRIHAKDAAPGVDPLVFHASDYKRLVAK